MPPICSFGLLGKYATHMFFFIIINNQAIHFNTRKSKHFITIYRNELKLQNLRHELLRNRLKDTLPKQTSSTTHYTCHHLNSKKSTKHNSNTQFQMDGYNCVRRCLRHVDLCACSGHSCVLVFVLEVSCELYLLQMNMNCISSVWFGKGFIQTGLCKSSFYHDIFTKKNE